MGHPPFRPARMGSVLPRRLLVLLLLLLPPSTTSLVVPLRRQGAAATASFLPPLQHGDKTTSPISNSTTTPTHLRAFIPGFYAYFAQLSFSNGEAGNGQAMDVLIDTGSHDLLIPTDLCTTCSQDIVSQRLDVTTAGAAFIRCDDAVACVGQCTPSMLEGVGLVNRADSPAVYCGAHGGMCEVGTESCLFVDYYADGSHASGVLVSATVDFAGVEIEDATFGAIDSASDSFFEAPQGGGIMGMAFREPVGAAAGMWACDDTPCVLPLLDTLVAQQQQQQQQRQEEEDVRDIFAIYGHPSAPVMLVGASSVGEEARGYYEGEIQYARMVQPHGLYMVAVAALGLRQGGKEEGGEDEFLLREAVGSVAIIDTGATGLFLPKSAYLELKTYLQTHYCHVPFICGPEATPLTAAAPAPTAPPAAATAQKQEKEPHRSLRRRHHHTRHRHPSSQDEEGEKGREEGQQVHPPTIFDEEIWAKYDEETLALLPTFVIRLEDGGVELRLTPKQYLVRNTFLSGEEEDGESGELEGGGGGGRLSYYHFGVATLDDGGEEDETEEKDEGDEGKEGRRKQSTEAQLRRKYKGMMPHYNNDKAGGSFRDLFIFGELLLNHVFVVFDREQRRVGFAPAVAQVLPSSPSSSSFSSPQLAADPGMQRGKVGSDGRSGGGKGSKN